MRLIDADDFANRMYHEAFVKDSDLQKWDSGCWIRYKLFENVLREQPTVEPERKKGNWVGIDDDPFDVYECDQCGAIYDTADNTWDLPDYCPMCGADMRGGDSNE